MNERLVDLLKPEVNSNIIRIVKCLEVDVIFDITTPFAGFTGGRLSFNENSFVELVVVSMGESITLPWDRGGVISSIERSKAFENNVKKLCAPTAFCNSNLPFIPMIQNKTTCTCEESIKVNKRLLAVDLSFPQISRQRGMITTGQCSNSFCQKWEISTFTLDARNINTRYDLTLLVDELCRLEGLVLNYDTILDSVNMTFKKYAVGTSKRQRAITQNEISKFKGLNLEEIKAKRLKG